MQSVKQGLGLKRIRLIGRDSLVKTLVSKARKCVSPTAIYFEGEGGSGKTAIMEELYRRLGKYDLDDVMIAEEIIDLYHVEYHTPQRLAKKIAEVFKKGGIGINFSGFYKKMEEIDQAYAQHQSEQGQKLWSEATCSMCKAISASAKEKPVILLFDTFEALGNLGEIVQSINAGKDDIEYFGDWLFNKMLANLEGKIFLVLAGRHEDVNERNLSLLKKSGWNIVNYGQLRPLKEKDCEAYLREVASQLKEEGHKTEAENIELYLDTYGTVPLHKQTGGNPLNLAFVADILAMGGEMPMGLYDGKLDIDKSFSSSLIKFFVSVPEPLGAILRAMSVLHKGANVKLITLLTAYKSDVVEKALAYLEKLVIFKKRPGREISRSFFLHDEIYRIYGQQKSRDDGNGGITLSYKERTRYYKNIEFYYQGEFNRISKEINKNNIFKEKYRQELRIAQAEFMHYVLWYDPRQGFSQYYNLANEAITRKNPFSYLLLRSEAVWTMKNQSIEVEGVKEVNQLLNADNKLKRIERYILVETNLKKAENVLEDMDDESIPDFSRVEYKLMQGILAIKKDEYIKSEELLNEARSSLERIASYPQVYEALRISILNYLGLTHRLQGRFGKAVDFYRETAALVRQANRTVSLSGILINLSYAMGILGWDRNARSTVNEAFQIASDSGMEYELVRAANVQAILEIRSGHPKNGEEKALYALNLLRKQTIQNKLIEGSVCINLARALRYQWNQVVVEQKNTRSWKKYL